MLNTTPKHKPQKKVVQVIIPSEYRNLQKAFEVDAPKSYTDCTTLFRHLPKYLAYKLAGVNGVPSGGCSLDPTSRYTVDTPPADLILAADTFNTRAAYLLRSYVIIKDAPHVLKSTQILQEVVNLMSHTKNRDLSKIEAILSSLAINKYLSENPNASQAKISRAFGIDRPLLSKMLNGGDLELVVRVNNTRNMPKLTEIASIEEEMESLRGRVAKLQEAQSLLLNALLSLSVTDSKTYNKLKAFLHE
jgi:hypothetical protein